MAEKLKPTCVGTARVNWPVPLKEIRDLEGGIQKLTEVQHLLEATGFHQALFQHYHQCLIDICLGADGWRTLSDSQ